MKTTKTMTALAISIGMVTSMMPVAANAASVDIEKNTLIENSTITTETTETKEHKVLCEIFMADGNKPEDVLALIGADGTDYILSKDGTMFTCAITEEQAIKAKFCELVKGFQLKISGNNDVPEYTVAYPSYPADNDTELTPSYPAESDKELTPSYPAESDKELTPSHPAENDTELTPSYPAESDKELIPSYPAENDTELTPSYPAENDKELIPSYPAENDTELTPSYPAESDKELTPSYPAESDKELIPSYPAENDTELTPSYPAEDEELPQTGMPWVRVSASLAGLMTVTGIAMVTVSKKKDEE